MRVVPARKQLIELIRKDSLRHGSFQMASGKTSDILIDLSTSLRTAEGQELLRCCIPDHFAISLEDCDAIGGPLSGVDLVAPALMEHGFAERWFGVRKQEKGRGLDQGAITGAFKKGDNVILVDDVMTTGGSTLDAAYEVLKCGGVPLYAFCIVDRGGAKNVSKALGIQCASLFKLEDLL